MATRSTMIASTSATESSLRALLLKSPTGTLPPCSWECHPFSTFSWSDLPIQGDVTESLLRQRLQTFSEVLELESPDLNESLEKVVSMNPRTESPVSVMEAPPKPKSKPNKKSVRFSPQMDVRTYNVILGDHPCTQGGLALSLGWEFTAEKVNRDVREEDLRQPRRLQEFHLTYVDRRNRLTSQTGLSGAQLLQLEYAMQLMECRPLVHSPSSSGFAASS